jgi:hypothetical protein
LPGVSFCFLLGFLCSLVSNVSKTAIGGYFFFNPLWESYFKLENLAYWIFFFAVVMGLELISVILHHIFHLLHVFSLFTVFR